MVWSCQRLCCLLQGNGVNQLPSFEGVRLCKGTKQSLLITHFKSLGGKTESSPGAGF